MIEVEKEIIEDDEEEEDGGVEDDDSADEASDGDTANSTTTTTNPMTNAKAPSYNDMTLSLSCTKGDLPTTVLIWGMYSANNLSPITPDSEQNNPLHFAALSDKVEVVDFIMQQTQGNFFTNQRLVDTTNSDGETPLLRAAALGKVEVIKSLMVSEQNKNKNIFRSEYFQI